MICTLCLTQGHRGHNVGAIEIIADEKLVDIDKLHQSAAKVAIILLILMGENSPFKTKALQFLAGQADESVVDEAISYLKQTQEFKERTKLLGNLGSLEEVAKLEKGEMQELIRQDAKFSQIITNLNFQVDVKDVVKFVTMEQ